MSKQSTFVVPAQFRINPHTFEKLKQLGVINVLIDRLHELHRSKYPLPPYLQDEDGITMTLCGDDGDYNFVEVVMFEAYIQLMTSNQVNQFLGIVFRQVNLSTMCVVFDVYDTSRTPIDASAVTHRLSDEGELEHFEVPLIADESIELVVDEIGDEDE